MIMPVTSMAAGPTMEPTESTAMATGSGKRSPVKNMNSPTYTATMLMRI